MFSRITHLIYLTAILLLVAALLRPSFQKTDSSGKPASVLTGKHPSTSQRPVAVPGIEDDTEYLQLAILDAPGAETDGSNPAVQRADIDHVAHQSLAPAILDQATDRLGSQSLRNGPIRLTPELADRVMEVARQIDPDFAGKLVKLRAKDAGAFKRIIQQRGGRLLAMTQLKQSDPELYATKASELSQTVQVNRVAAELRKATQAGGSQSQIDVLQRQLRTLLQVQLAMSIKSRGEYLCRLEENIQKVRNDVNTEAKHFQETVEGRMQHHMRAPAGETSPSTPADTDPETEPGQ